MMRKPKSERAGPEPRKVGREGGRRQRRSEGTWPAKEQGSSLESAIKPLTRYISHPPKLDTRWLFEVSEHKMIDRQASNHAGN